jgi:hypothetical protein
MRDVYEEIDSIQLTNCQVVLSKRGHGGRDILAVAPRKTFSNEAGQLVAFIPKRSAIEFHSEEELDDFIAALIEIRNSGILR